MSDLAYPLAPPAAGPGEGEEVYVLPCSFAQARLWFLDRLEPGSSLYNMPLTRRIKGPLDVEALRRALEEIVARHESLRTVFTLVGGEPMQVISPPARLELPVEDFSHLPEEGLDRILLDRMTAENTTPFDLAQGPVFRARLLRARPEVHYLVLVMHHIAGDGWSLSVLGREMAVLYEAFRDGRESPLPELPIQYADFAQWQRDHLDGGELERQVSFWRARLEGAPAVLELPADRPRPPVQTYPGALHTVDIPPETTAALTRIARGEGGTQFMALLSLSYVLLWRWSGEPDLVVGTPVAGRDQQETEGLIGIFLNSLALRADLSDDPTFRTLLVRVRDVVLDARQHQDLPFEKLVEELRVERSLSHPPLFQVMVSLESAATGMGSGAQAEGLEIAGVAGSVKTSKFDLSITGVEAPGGILRVGFEYNTDLFDAATIARMGEHFRRLAESAAAEPGRRVSRLALLPDEEREAVLGGWRAEAGDAVPSVSVHERAAALARVAPDAVAVEHEGRRLSRAELEAMANRLANRLRRMGVGPEARVGVCLERSPEMVAALLAVLKAGGACLPLDPVYPPERLAYQLEDAGARVLVTHSSLAERLPEVPGVVRLLLDEEAGALAAESAEAPAVPVHPQGAAYCIYTSGSTGRPKGVVLTHGSLAAYAAAMPAFYGVTAADRVLQFASVSFDISLEEMLLALVSGAALVLRTDAMLASAADFLRLAGAWGVTVVSLPTAFWHTVAAEAGEGGPAIPPSLRLAILGGEAPLPERVARWQRASGGRVTLVNSYGPTETTISSTALVLGPEAGMDGAPLPIGRPLPGQRACVVDDAGELCPVGLPGELCIGGAGVARGYLDRPGMTAERFVPDPFSGVAGARMYRTGDRARLRPGGELEFLRRRDDQVKVRGFRVEPGEVEAALREEAGLRDAVVLARRDAGETRLVAYVVPHAGAEAPDPAALRAALRERLPDYMVPAAVVVLEALPLTPSGKTDRRALPAPPADGESSAGPVAPEGETEEAVAAVWREVLGIEAVGAGDNFFDLGGHSILLARVQVRLRETLGAEVGMVTLFRYPTVRSLAAALARGGGDDRANERARGRAESRRAAREARRERR